MTFARPGVIVPYNTEKEDPVMAYSARTRKVAAQAACAVSSWANTSLVFVDAIFVASIFVARITILPLAASLQRRKLTKVLAPAAA